MIVSVTERSGNSVGHKEQHKDNEGTVNQHLILTKTLKDFCNKNNDGGADDRPTKGTHATYQNHHQEHGGLVCGEGFRTNEADQMSIEGAADKMRRW